MQRLPARQALRSNSPAILKIPSVSTLNQLFKSLLQLSFGNFRKLDFRAKFILNALQSFCPVSKSIVYPKPFAFFQPVIIPSGISRELDWIYFVWKLSDRVKWAIFIPIQPFRSRLVEVSVGPCYHYLADLDRLYSFEFGQQFEELVQSFFLIPLVFFQQD